jgi:hypothetical protein
MRLDAIDNTNTHNIGRKWWLCSALRIIIVWKKAVEMWFIW